jgi:hypothetical protein
MHSGGAGRCGAHRPGYDTGIGREGALTLRTLIARKLDSARFKTWCALGVGTLPNAIILGGMRCGTTSLWNYLTQHPRVRGSRIKELNFFCGQFGKGEGWYKANFTPARHETVFIEASPCYLFHPLAASRAARMVPDAKLIALLREPVDRAYSHYNQNVELGLETLPLEDAVRREEDLRPLWEAEVLAGQAAHSHHHQTFSYVGKSLYAEQLSTWLKHYPRQQMLIIRSEDLYARTQDVLDEVTDFLALDRFPFPDLSVKNGRDYDRHRQPMRGRLQAIFDRPNRDLKALTGIGWN